MKQYFDAVPARRGTNCAKWDTLGANELPMWVADMDFVSAPAIQKALRKRVEHGVFGYNTIPDEWYDAYSSWWERRHGLTFSKSNLIFCIGVITAISSVIRKLTTPAEKILVQTPVYNHFFTCILNNGRVVFESKLIHENNTYSIDFEDLEEKLSDPQTTAMLLCNPQNPTGNVWSREDLAKVGALCKKHNVLVLSDEIHCDITAPGVSYVPFASVNDECKYNSVTFIAPTKAFNLAGIQTSAALVYDRGLYNRVYRALNTDEVTEPNTLAVCAAVSAFNECEEWLDGMREYVYENKRVTSEFLSREIPEIKVTNSSATYLLWLDCSGIFHGDVNPSEYIRKSSGLYASDGAIYGAHCSKFIRFNIACPRSQLLDALSRLRAAVDKFKNE